MGSDVARRGHERPASGHEQRPVSVDGFTFWTARRAGHAVELTTETGIDLDADRCRWTVASPGSTGTGQRIETASRDVIRFVGGVLNSMQREARRATVRPVPKPQPKPAAPLPPTAPVPCPLCHGEAWPDCELCDGAGVVTQRRADEWRELHGT